MHVEIWHKYASIFEYLISQTSKKTAICKNIECLHKKLVGNLEDNILDTYPCLFSLSSLCVSLKRQKNGKCTNNKNVLKLD